jgi:hypothetical protein
VSLHSAVVDILDQAVKKRTVMASAKGKRMQGLDEDIVALNSTWGSVMDDGLRQANETLRADDWENDETREAWTVVSRAFRSGVSALRDLSN